MSFILKNLDRMEGEELEAIAAQAAAWHGEHCPSS
jgi:hypothetical protein